MKSLLLSVALLVATVPAQAVNFQYCAMIQQLAEASMSAYQAGVPKAELLEMADNPTVYRVVSDATSRHKFLTEKFQDESSYDFGFEYFAMCLDGNI